MIERSPERPNVQFVNRYLDRHEPVCSTFSDVLSDVRRNGKTCTRTMIFCQTRNQCTNIYSAFQESLGDNLYLDNTPCVKKRLVEIYHAGTPASVKKHILENVSQKEGHIRIVICTVAALVWALTVKKCIASYTMALRKTWSVIFRNVGEQDEMVSLVLVFYCIMVPWEHTVWMILHNK